MSDQKENKSTTLPVVLEEKTVPVKNKKISDEEKKELVDLYSSNFSLDEKELPHIGDEKTLSEMKSKDLQIAIANSLRKKHKVLRYFNGNKLLIIVKHVQEKHYPKKTKVSKKETEADIHKKIAKLNQKLAAIRSGVAKAIEDEEDEPVFD